MEIKGIDVSAWQGDIDWEKVAAYGMGFAILRVTEAGNVTDSKFERNYKGCRENGIPAGVYKYGYALTVKQAQEEAEAVVSVLNGRGLDFPVFYDLEYDKQRSLGKEAVAKIAEAFLSRIRKAGYRVGLYCNMDWYENVLTDELKEYDCWIARYPADDDGTLKERLRVSSDIAVGWQYSSKAAIPGIPEKVDRNVFYKDYTDTKKDAADSDTADSASDAAEKGGTMIFKTIDEAIIALIAIAEEEIGYLEKKSNSNLDDKTANAGSNNYTKYWRDAYPAFQGQAWCAIFLAWCFMKAFGLDLAKKLLKHWPYVYCPTLGNLFTKYANPQKGDIVIFYRNGTFTHTGLVIKVSGDQFWTIEGNTSGASGIVANGGGVCGKSYYNSQLPGTKFCRPDYSIVTGISIDTDTDSGASSTTSTSTGGSYMFSVGTVQSGSTGNDVKLLQRLLKSNGMKGADGKKLSIDGSCGANTVYAIKTYQKKKKLSVDGIAGDNTWKSILLR